MTATMRAVRLELLKLRRTLVLPVAVICAVLSVGLTAWLATIGLRALDRHDWGVLVESDALFWWGIFVFPPLVGLEAALLAELDQRSGHWARLFALPVPRWSLYSGKLLVGALILALSSLILAGGIALVGVVLADVGAPNAPSLPVDWGEIGRQVGATFLAGLLMLAIQLWVAVSWRGVSVPLGLALVGTVVGFVLDLSGRAAYVARLFPWSLSFIAGTHTDDSQAIAMWFGVLAGIAVALLGCWEVNRRDVL
jgi:ABC-2 type transport system permease protein